MWVFLNKAFLSIVQDRGNAQRLLVRGRIAGDIQKVFPLAEVEETPNADYRYRAFVPRDAVALALYSSALSIDYTNFKGSVNRRDHNRQSAYMRVWSEMQQAQTQDQSGSNGFLGDFNP